jgi:hypothetical protein
VPDRCVDCKSLLIRLPHGGTAFCCRGAYLTVLAPAPRDSIIARDLGIMWNWFSVIGLPVYIYGPRDWPHWRGVPGDRTS